LIHDGCFKRRVATIPSPFSASSSSGPNPRDWRFDGLAEDDDEEEEEEEEEVDDEGVEMLAFKLPTPNAEKTSDWHNK
jgi:hypothetical protein